MFDWKDGCTVLEFLLHNVPSPDQTYTSYPTPKAGLLRQIWLNFDLIRCFWQKYFIRLSSWRSAYFCNPCIIYFAILPHKQESFALYAFLLPFGKTHTQFLPKMFTTGAWSISWLKETFLHHKHLTYLYQSWQCTPNTTQFMIIDIHCDAIVFMMAATPGLVWLINGWCMGLI